MCGIIGVLETKQRNNLASDTAELLKKLEYRGYDSWGLAVIGNQIDVDKKIGKVTTTSIIKDANIAIGHSRWATHGGVTDENAHPHLDCKGEIAVVHNGIIENYLELKEQLIKTGHVFKSETDTEIIPHLIEVEFVKHGDLYAAVKSTIKLLKGTFGLVVASSKAPNIIITARKDSPIAIAINGTRAAISSDPIAFAEYNKAYFLENGEMSELRIKDGKLVVEFYDFLIDKQVQKKETPLNLEKQDSELGAFNHFMEKEINGEPDTLLNILNQDFEKVKDIAQDIAMAKHVVLPVCGTSRHAALVGKHIINQVTGKNIEAMIASEFTYFADKLTPETLVVAVSQSGETSDVLECTRKAKKNGCRVIAIVNTPTSSLARESDKVMYINCGTEVAVASTKAFINQVAAFYLLAHCMAGKLDEAATDITNISKLIKVNLPYFDLKAREIAQVLKHKSDAYYLGKGVNFAIALEGALKLKEISYIHAEGMPAGELKHGTLALVEKETPVIIIAPTDYTHSDIISSGIETKARGATIIGVSNEKHPSFDYFVQLPTLKNKLYYPIIETIPLQLIAYYTAKELGRNIDKPRNLAKSVTVR